MRSEGLSLISRALGPGKRPRNTLEHLCVRGIVLPTESALPQMLRTCQLYLRHTGPWRQRDLLTMLACVWMTAFLARYVGKCRRRVTNLSTMKQGWRHFLLKMKP